ncbi:MAG: excinuclease ABC subunit C [Chloroflexi bacterium]|nr:excinuclease ABC subunit C [Chloroflexota bacterium]|tara:strand:+ start:12571 stop:14454 length:1884 start_codon:yes stop_codon:yes gene_type:complete
MPKQDPQKVASHKINLKQSFQSSLNKLPKSSGVYLMKDESNQVIYVGKAANLRNRVSSYFQSYSRHDFKIRTLVSKISRFETIVTESEQEALILESNLIKEHQPKYNARLKDDKSYPFIKIDVSEQFPQVYITRRVNKKDGARYFGPYANAGSVRKTLKLLKKLFPYRSCTKTITGSDDRACLDFHIGRCVGPCIGAADKYDYKNVIDQVILFLEGKTNKVVKNIQQKMLQASNSLEYESAAVYRDQLKSIENLQESQKVVTLNSDNYDAIAIAQNQNESWVEVFFVREGKLIGRDNFSMTSNLKTQPSELTAAFIKQFYLNSTAIPKLILIKQPIDDEKTIADWLSIKSSQNVQFHIPIRGKKRQLLKMVSDNANNGLNQLLIRRSTAQKNVDSALSEIQEALHLPNIPKRIECYDISNISGTNPVGSMVVFENGSPAPNKYRRFKIKNIPGIDDYSMMQEMLERRFKRLNDSTADKISSNQNWKTIPDLIVIDGGKGHLTSALEVLLHSGLNELSITSLAKENEELFVPESPEPIILPRDSQGLFLLQRLRDEAHRFAITFHRQLRSQKSLKSKIDDVPGIGPKKRKLLINHFGSMKNIQKSSIEEISSLPGINKSLAKTLLEFL